MLDKYAKVTTEEAYKRYCSECGAEKNKPCTYKTGDLIGAPTSRPHNRRYDNEYWKLYRWMSVHGLVLLKQPKRKGRC